MRLFPRSIKPRSSELPAPESEVATGRSEEPHRPRLQNPRWPFRISTVCEGCSFYCPISTWVIKCVVHIVPSNYCLWTFYHGVSIREMLLMLYYYGLFVLTIESTLVILGVMPFRGPRCNGTLVQWSCEAVTRIRMLLLIWDTACPCSCTFKSKPHMGSLLIEKHWLVQL